MQQPLVPYQNLEPRSPKAERKGARPLDLKRLMEHARPDRGLIMIATGALFLSAVFNLLIPGIVGAVIDSMSSLDAPPSAQSGFTRYFIKMGFRTPNQILGAAIIALAIAIGLGGFFGFLRGYWFTLAGERVVARLRRNLFDNLISLEVGFFDVTRTAELTNRLATDTTVLEDAATVNISMGLRYGATVIGGIVYLFVISWKLTLVMLSIIPFVLGCGMLFRKRLKDLSKQTQDALARATEVAEESFSNIRTVRAFSRETIQGELYAEKIQASYDLGAKAAWWYGAFTGLVGVVAGASVLVVLWYGATLVLDKQMTSGVLTAYVLYTLTVSGAVGGLMGLVANLMKALGANERVFELLDRTPLIPIKGGDVIPEFTGTVRFENVCFSYPSRPGQKVLENFNLVLKPGTVTALVGPSGGGKSTVVKLIERFYDIDAGCITVDGRDIRSLDLTSYHRHVALIDQEPVLFSRTIGENIVFGADGASEEDVVRAAKMANAHDFVSGFPDQYATVVGERGIRLSGGQKQRIAIARAILMNPTILIADEATSSLDAESEYRVQEALDRVMKGRTVLVVAHRLSTIKNADNVVVIGEGRVLEQGTHNELLARSGTYAKLVQRQLTGQELGTSHSISIEKEDDARLDDVIIDDTVSHHG